MALTERERLYLENAVELIGLAEAAAKALRYSFAHRPELARERTRERLHSSLRSGTQEMLETEVPFEAEAVMTTVEIPLPARAFDPTVAA